jgi:hypothetical protein
MCERQRYSTIDDVVSYAIDPVCGEFPDDYDVYAIARELFEFTSDVDENGVQRGNAYFIEREDMDWDSVMQKHDHGEELDKIVADAWSGYGTYAFTESNGHMENIKCDSEKDLKHELHEFLQCYDCWDNGVVVTKVSDL